MSENGRIITLDGPGGVGKTTVAKSVAARLEIAYLDTGAMFRAAALQLGEGGWDLSDEDIATVLESLSFQLQGSGKQTTLLVNGQSLPESARSEVVGLWASNVGRIERVRSFLKREQRRLGRDNDLVAEGRDMGTVVFPNAGFKFFLDASPEERARRRWLQLRSQGSEESYDSILQALRIRDQQDRTRPVAPLRPADDAVIIDTSHLTLGEVLDRVLDVLESDWNQ